MSITANPQSKGIVVENRYQGPYNGKATIDKVDIVNSKDESVNGSIVVHLTGSLDNKEVKMIDFFGRKKTATVSDEAFAQQMLNRATSAQESAGVTHFNEAIEPAQVRGKVKEIFDGLVGKTVTISQWTRPGFSRPNINYKFGKTVTAQELPL